MAEKKHSPKIKIMKNGPYIVTGNVPLSEKIIVPVENGEYGYADGDALPQAATYALCRCGKTKNPPFCDGSHQHFEFNGDETASTRPYEERAELYAGHSVDLLDDHRCAYARLCHRKNSIAWDLARHSNTEENRLEAIQGANDCPAGRLTAVDKDGIVHEPDYEPAIVILQDPQVHVSGGIFVMGNIPIVSEDGTAYEVRNRVTLCRCGHSRNKPFCDAAHVKAKYRDQE